MGIREIASIIKKTLSIAGIRETYGKTGNGNKPYRLSNLIFSRALIDDVSKMPMFSIVAENLMKSALYSSNLDEIDVDATARNEIIGAFDRLIDQINTLLRYADQLEKIPEESIAVTLPPFENFEDLARLSNELKKAIEIPINDQNKGGRLQIISAEAGSIILTATLEALPAVSLIAAICKAAINLRKKLAEAKAHEQYTRSLEIQNDVKEVFAKAVKIQITNVLDFEAKTIAENNYDAADQDTINRLKLSITSMADFFEKGGKVLPVSEQPEIKQAFPDYSVLNQIQESIQHLISDDKKGSN